VVASDLIGNRLVVWAAPDADGLGIFGQRYGADGLSIGERLQLNLITAGDQHSPAVAASDAGRLVVVWLSVGGTTGRSRASIRVVGRILGSDGTPLTGELQINTTALATSNGAAVAVRPTSGDLIIAWHGTQQGKRQAGSSIRSRVFKADGTALGAEIAVSQVTSTDLGKPDVAINKSGEAVVVWASRAAPNQTDVLARQLDIAGAATAAMVQVVQVTQDPVTGWTRPAVVVKEDGSFVVGWHQRSPGISAYQPTFLVQSFTAEGEASGRPLSITGDRHATVRNVSLEIDANGDCWAVWEQEGSGTVSGHARLLTGCTRPVGDILLLGKASPYHSLRSLSAAVAGDGTLTAVYSSDDRNEGDGSVYGISHPRAIPGEAPRRASTRH
jgi:hypothetical protein